MDIVYNHDSNKITGMICNICNAFGNPPVQARGIWVSRPVNNLVKATSLLRKHGLAEWHFDQWRKRHSHILLSNKEI